MLLGVHGEFLSEEVFLATFSRGCSGSRRARAAAMRRLARPGLSNG
jgi:hypothetical protein